MEKDAKSYWRPSGEVFCECLASDIYIIPDHALQVETIQRCIPKLQTLRNRYLKPLCELAKRKELLIQDKLEKRKDILNSYQDIINSMIIPPSNGILWMYIVLEMDHTPEALVQQYIKAHESIVQLLVLWDEMLPVDPSRSRDTTEDMIVQDIKEMSDKFNSEVIPNELVHRTLQERYEEELGYWRKNRQEWETLVETTICEMLKLQASRINDEIGTLDSIRSSANQVRVIDKNIAKIKTQSHKVLV